jgi:hypothetical protein
MYEKQTIEIVRGARAEVLVRIVEEAWADLMPRMPRRKRTRAVDMWENMINLADEYLVPMEGVHRFERNRIPTYVIDDAVAIRFKKHDDSKLTRNILTGNQRDLVSQRPIDGLPPDIVHLPCGYQLDRAQAEIFRIWLSKPIGPRKVEWAIDLRELAAGNEMPATEPLPIQPPVAPGLPHVRSTHRKLEGGKASQ